MFVAGWASRRISSRADPKALSSRESFEIHFADNRLDDLVRCLSLPENFRCTEGNWSLRDAAKRIEQLPRDHEATSSLHSLRETLL